MLADREAALSGSIRRERCPHVNRLQAGPRQPWFRRIAAQRVPRLLVPALSWLAPDISATRTGRRSVRPDTESDPLTDRGLVMNRWTHPTLTRRVPDSSAMPSPVHRSALPSKQLMGVFASRPQAPLACTSMTSTNRRFRPFIRGLLTNRMVSRVDCTHRYLSEATSRWKGVPQDLSRHSD